MKKFIKLFKNRIVLFFGITLFISLIPYFVCYFKAPYVNTYSISFSTSDFNQDEILNSENVNSLKNYFVAERNEEIATKGSSKKVDYSTLDTIFLIDNSSIESNEYNFTFKVSKACFKNKNSAKKFMTNLLERNIDKNNLSYVDAEVIKENDKIDVIQIYFIGLLVSFILCFSIFIILYFVKPQFFNQTINYDNINLYRTIFHKSYWQNQTKWMKKLKYLTTLSILISLMLTMKLIKIPSGFSNLGIGFTYLIFSVISMIYGPLTGIFVGFVSDVLGYVISPSPYGFYFPYTISSMLSGFIYGVCFYKTNVSYTKCLISRFFVNMFVNVILGSIWWALLTNLSFEGFKSYLLFTELPKNLAYLLPQSILQFVVLKALIVPLQEFDLISLAQKEAIRVI